MAHLHVVHGGVRAREGQLEVIAHADVGYSVLEIEDMFAPAQLPWLERCGGAAMLVCMSPTIDRLYGERIRGAFAGALPAGRVHYLTVQTTEAHKTLESAVRVCEAARQAQLDRNGMLVAIGGGITLDLVGFAASLYRRGIRFVKVPTTVVGQVDVAVGIKTGVNAAGAKNLLGTYYPAYLAINDRQFLRTLPARELRCGLAEVIKMGVVCDGEIFEALDAISEPLGRARAGERDALLACLEPAVMTRAMLRMMEQLQPNLFEADLERLVDFGHTFSMSIETGSDFAYAHGEAVAIDMALSACISHQLGLLPAAELARLLALLARLGLRTFDREHCALDAMWAALREAEVHRGQRINLVVPRRLGEGVFLRQLAELPRAVLARAIAQLDELSRCAPPGDPAELADAPGLGDRREARDPRAVGGPARAPRSLR
jgi:3-dehydroquinate synthase